MKGKKSAYLAASVLFVIVETVLGYSLQVETGRKIALFSFASIVVACFFCLVFFSRTKQYLFTQLAMVCTLIADYLLIICTPPIKPPAMVVFLGAQLLYFFRLYDAEPSLTRKKVQCGIHGALCVAVLIATVIVLKKNCDLLAVVSMLYYVTLIVNAGVAFSRFKKHSILAIGLLLFILCDTMIGMSMLEGYFSIPTDSVIYKIIHPGFDLAWACYLPSQMLIVLSLLPDALKRCSKTERGENDA